MDELKKEIQKLRKDLDFQAKALVINSIATFVIAVSFLILVASQH